MRKPTLAIPIIATVAACAALAETAIDAAKSRIKAMRDDGSLTNVVNQMIADKVICEVRGHQWAPGCGMGGCLVIHSGPTRHCTMCGTYQEQIPGNWK